MKIVFHWQTIVMVNTNSVYKVQWDQCSPGNSASHYSDQSMMKLDFLATWVVLDFSKEVPKIFLFSEISILCDKNPLKRP